MYSGYVLIYGIEFTIDDVVRSSLVRDWIIACNDLDIDL